MSAATTVWSHRLLNALRQIGDPELDWTPGEGDGWQRIPVSTSGEVSGRRDLLELWRTRDEGALPDGKRLLQEIKAMDRDGVPLAERYWSSRTADASPQSIATARDLFVEYGAEIGATLLLASLPHAYASEIGSAVLSSTEALRSDTRRRISETAQFVVEVLFPEPTLMYHPPKGGGREAEEMRKRWVHGNDGQGVPRGSRGYVRTRTTRLTHAVIRSVIGEKTTEDQDGNVFARWDPSASAGIPRFQDTKNSDLHVLRGVPINQEDLLGTLGTFTVTVWQVMEKLGVPWNTRAEQAYLDLWNQVGELLGIGTEAVTDRLEEARIPVPDDYKGCLRPKTPAEARELCKLIQARNWPLPLPDRVLGPFAGAGGKLLVRALLDELQTAMPRGMERVPLTVMRYLVDESIHELLGLGGGGVLEGLLRLPEPDGLGRTPAPSIGRGVVQRGMRLAASDISRRAFIHFIEQKAKDPKRSDFWFPVLPQQDMQIRPLGRIATPRTPDE